ncbi:MAG: Fe-S cluster assembly protein SufD [Ignavibacteriales bacterium]|nr:Fe-S cluster assembly protein SufD [Ignavibacteriales bacterium]
MDQPNKIDLKEWYNEKFKIFEKNLNGQSKTYIHGLRKQAIEKFAELGFPTTKSEDWKYTNLTPLLNFNYVPAVLENETSITANEIEKYLIKDLKATLLVFVNGIYVKELSRRLPQTEKIEVIKFNSLSQSDVKYIENHFSKYVKIDNGFVALNTAFSLNGVIIKIPENLIVEDPIHFLFLSGDEKTNVLAQPRNILLAGKNSQTKIIESYHSISENPYLLNSVNEIVLEENAILDFYKIQNEGDKAFHISRTEVHQKRSSVFTSTTISMGGEIIRNDLNAVLADENSECHFFGLYLADGKRLVDNHTLIDHAKPHCHSNELYKGILDEKSRGVFNGKVIVRKDAQKTLAYQSNKNLLISRDARIDTKPQLEIFADDVKCSHGATVGQLDDQSLFYLQSRGISKEKARSILIKAFASDIIDLIKIDQLKDQLSEKILDRLHQVSVG